MASSVFRCRLFTANDTTYRYCVKECFGLDITSAGPDFVSLVTLLPLRRRDEQALRHCLNVPVIVGFLQQVPLSIRRIRNPVEGHVLAQVHASGGGEIPAIGRTAHRVEHGGEVGDVAVFGCAVEVVLVGVSVSAGPMASPLGTEQTSRPAKTISPGQWRIA